MSHIRKKCNSMHVILQKLKKLGYIVLKQNNYVNVHKWRFLLRVLTDKSVQRVQRYLPDRDVVNRVWLLVDVVYLQSVFRAKKGNV